MDVAVTEEVLVNLPVFDRLCLDMGFNPQEPLPIPADTLDEPWNLDQEYPPSFRELVGQLTGQTDVSGYLYEQKHFWEYMAAMEAQDATESVQEATRDT
jgi:hypothetical protein